MVNNKYAFRWFYFNWRILLSQAFEINQSQGCIPSSAMIDALRRGACLLGAGPLSHCGRSPVDGSQAWLRPVYAPKGRQQFAAGDYIVGLQVLASLCVLVDAFFEHVMVNAEDPAFRVNHLGLRAALYEAMDRVADLASRCLIGCNPSFGQSLAPGRFSSKRYS